MRVETVHGYLVAKWLSRVFHPFAICALSILLSIYLDTSSLLVAVQWFVVSVLFLAIPMLFIQVMVKTGRYSDNDVSVRGQRHSTYLVGGIVLLLLLIALTLSDAPSIARACFYAITATTIVGAALNRCLTKISAHSMIAACGAAIITHLSWSIGLVLVLVAIAVGWSRVQLERHTPDQVVLGWAVGATNAVVILRLVKGG